MGQVSHKPKWPLALSSRRPNKAQREEPAGGVCAWRLAASHKGTHNLQPRWQHKHRTKLRTDPDQHQMIASPGCQQSSTALAAEALLGASLTLTCRATVLYLNTSLEHREGGCRAAFQVSGLGRKPSLVHGLEQNLKQDLMKSFHLPWPRAVGTIQNWK